MVVKSMKRKGLAAQSAQEPTYKKDTKIYILSTQKDFTMYVYLEKRIEENY